MFKIDVCKVCGINCFWIAGIDGELAEKEVCSPKCLAQLAVCPTKYAPDVASAASAEPLSGLESVPAIEFDTQPRG